jgi:DNA-binding NarL/FixJ family response regulator
MHARPKVALIGDDLLMRSRVESAAGQLVDPEDAEVCLVDLNRDPSVAIERIAHLSRACPSLEIVGFCDHGADETRLQAMAAGAVKVVTNSAVAEVALEFANRHD